MPLPMVHCAVAIQLFAHQQCLPDAEFVLGSIAPDAIHMRSNADRADKRRTHLNEPADTREHTQVRTLLSHYSRAPKPLASFAAGYVAHILTDRLWVQTLQTSFDAQLASNTDPDVKRTLYYQETDQIDFNLYHASSWRPQVWELLEAAVAPAFQPLLNASEIDQWRQRTLNWFDALENEPHFTPLYITDQMVEHFILETADEIADRLTQWQVVI
jgi:hypothetical protein